MTTATGDLPADRTLTAEAAARLVRPGQVVFVGSALSLIHI